MGSGRVVVDNKGNVVKQYEPFFSGSSEFTPETELTEWGVTPLFFYDPVGRNTRVELPDDSVRTWVFNPWRLEAKDEEDNKSGGDHENTPTVTHLDAQGRVFRTDAYLVDASTVTNEDTDTDVLRTSVELDVQGNPVTVTDPRGNDIQEQTFDLLGRPLFTGSADEGYTGSNDTGETRILPDVAGQVVKTWRSHDGSNELVLTRTFDTLRRPVQLSVTDDGGTTTRLVEYRLYGEFDGGSGTKAKGRLWRLYDTAGELEITAYDFKGNILEMSKTLPDDFTADEDWTGIAANSTKTALATWLSTGGGAGTLSSDTYTLERTFDALNRLLTETGPDAEIGGSGAASVTTYTYDKGSRLKTVEVAVRGASATTFVSDITYNARGQRLTIVKGDDATTSPTTGDFTTTTYTYDADRLWLTDLVTTRDSDSATLQDLTYTRDAVGNITQIDDAAQSTLYYSNTQVNRQRTFAYDALYRLTEATGREKDALAQPGPSLPTKYAVPAAGAQDALMRNYTQTYVYDEAGNLTEMKHFAGGSTQWRRGYDLATGNNQLLKSSEPGDTFGTPSTYSSSYSYNRRGAMLFLPHLHNNAGADNLVRDYRDQLREAKLNANDSTFYVYDAAGNRVAKSVEGGQNRYVTLYLWGYEVFQEIDSTGPTVKEERHTLHVMDDVNRICLVESRTIQSSGSYTHAPTPLCRFQFDDHLGTACVETDVDIAVISYEEYHPYGTTAWWASNAAVDKRYRFTGKERDEETGLSYHGQRYLITWLGRWERVDPIGLGDGGNQHHYVGGSVIGSRDRSGMAKESFADPDSRSRAQNAQARLERDLLSTPKTLSGEIDRLDRLGVPTGFIEEALDWRAEFYTHGATGSSTKPNLVLIGELARLPHEATHGVLQSRIPLIGALDPIIDEEAARLQGAMLTTGERLTAPKDLDRAAHEALAIFVERRVEEHLALSALALTILDNRDNPEALEWLLERNTEQARSLDPDGAVGYVERDGEQVQIADRTISEPAKAWVEENIFRGALPVDWRGHRDLNTALDELPPDLASRYREMLDGSAP